MTNPQALAAKCAASNNLAAGVDCQPLTPLQEALASLAAMYGAASNHSELQLAVGELEADFDLHADVITANGLTVSSNVAGRVSVVEGLATAHSSAIATLQGDVGSMYEGVFGAAGLSSTVQLLGDDVDTINAQSVLKAEVESGEIKKLAYVAVTANVAGSGLTLSGDYIMLTANTGGVLQGNYVAGVSGLKLDLQTGNAELNNLTARGEVHATTGSLGTLTVAGTVTMGTNGEIKNSAGTYSITNAGVAFQAQVTYVSGAAIEWSHGARIWGQIAGGVDRLWLEAPDQLNLNAPDIQLSGAVGAVNVSTGTLAVAGIGFDVLTLVSPGQVLAYNGTNLVAANANAHSHSASQITSGTLDAARLPGTVLTSSSNLNALSDVSGTPSNGQIMQRQSGVWQPATVQNAMTNALGGPVPYIASGFLEMPATALTGSPPVSQTNSFIPVHMGGGTYYIRLYAV